MGWAGHGVVIHKASGLHEGIANHRPAKIETFGF